MTDIAASRSRVRMHSPILLPLLASGAIGGLALIFVAYLLWPRWPGATVALDAPAFPITVQGVAFNVPPAAVRVAVQRRPGAHERIDLMFLWPSLEPPDPHHKPALPAHGAPEVAAPALDRIFLTIAGAGETFSPAERVRAIYPRYLAAASTPGPGGLSTLAFRADTPYQGEDLLYDSAPGTGFFARCTRSAGSTPGTCLYERRIDKVDVVARFPRDWLADWRTVANGIDGLIARLRPRG